MAANATLVMLAPKPKENNKIDIQVKQNSVEIDNIHETTAELLDNIDLSGLQDWSPEEQQQVKDLILEYSCIFAMNDMDFGKTSLVKHCI